MRRLVLMLVITSLLALSGGAASALTPRVCAGFEATPVGVICIGTTDQA